MQVKIALSALAVCLFATGCWTPNYKKIPLQQNDIPYVLADGDYKDVQGNLHVDQHDVWAMSQADVYDYMKYIRKISAKDNETTIDKVKKLPALFTKKNVAVALAVVFAALLSLIAILRHKIKKLNDKVDELKLRIESNVNTENAQK